MLELIVREPAKKTKQTPLLFIHGAWHGAWCWDEYFLPYFAEQGYAVYAPSLRGHGQSEGRERLRWTAAADYVADVAETVAKLPQPPIIIGHSMGGYVVQKYLETTTLPGAILLASVPPQGVWRIALRSAWRFPKQFAKLNLKLSLYPLVETAELTKFHFFSQDMPQEQVNRYFTKLGDESYRGFLDMLLFNLPRPARVQTPMLVFGGQDDAIFSMNEVKATAHAYNTTPHFFPMAHDMMLEAGWEQVAGKMLMWLENQGID
ncbi:alpha/beta hydrolase [Candidatus Leptofilum sp.]|uniref:alpha/beta hydrolase n=1 Tax=Candidatus Leptofilum sp. TaxID=3241576 RepID=UPI003B5ACAC9